MKISILASLIAFCLLFISNLYAKDEVIYGDLTGNGVKEKIIINIFDKTGMIISLSVVSGSKLVYSFKTFKKVPFEYSKIVNFSGLSKGAKRDILFIVVGECDAYLHILTYERNSSDDGGKKINGKYVVKEFISQVDSCY